MNENYIRAACRSVGVAPMWLEDACQDIALASWIEGREDGQFIRRRAIDAARKYGVRRQHEPLTTQRAPDAYHAADTWMDAQRGFRRLTGLQRASLALVARGVPLGDRMRWHRNAARARLRRYLAA